MRLLERSHAACVEHLSGSYSSQHRRRPRRGTVTEGRARYPFTQLPMLLALCAKKDIEPLSNHVPPLREKRLVRLDLEQHVCRGNALRSERCVPNLRYERWKVVCRGFVANGAICRAADEGQIGDVVGFAGCV